jgi:hypothetical protein
MAGGAPATVTNETALLVDLLPVVRRTFPPFRMDNVRSLTDSWYERAEEHRVRALRQARASGSWDDPVLWWMKIHPASEQPRLLWSPTRDGMWSGLKTYETITVRHQHPDGHQSENWYKVTWEAAGRAHAVRCAVLVSVFPPALEERVADLSDVYVFGVDGAVASGCMQFGHQRKYPEPIHTRDLTTEKVVADGADFRRWHQAADTYLRDLDAVRFDLAKYWFQHGRLVAAPAGQDGPLQRWQDRVEAGYTPLQAWQDRVKAGYARLARGSDAYRPVLEEVTAAVRATVPAYEYQVMLCQRLEDWAQRPLWRLVPTGPDVFLLARSDIVDAVPAESAPEGLPAVFTQAHKKRTDELCAVDWDAASVRACDAELAALAARYPPLGTTRSGQPMTSPSPTRFATWFSARFGTIHDKISDRDALTRDRQRRAEVRTPVDRHTGSSAYHTDLGIHIDIGGYGSPSF